MARTYRAWALTSFVGADLSVRRAKLPPRLRQPRQTERIVLKMPITFPSQEKYKQDNETLQGIEDGVDAAGLEARDRLADDED